MKLTHVYHCYATPEGVAILEKHLKVLKSSGLLKRLDNFWLGVVGPEREHAAALCDTTIIATAPVGYEQITLHALWLRVKQQQLEGAVLYAHTKGASQPTVWNDRWRTAMTSHVVGHWKTCVRQLKKYDAVGTFWLNPSRLNQPNRGSIPFFAGNFWWARAEYLANLQAPLTERRWQAEEWIGSGQPEVYDLMPGFPSEVIK